MKPAFRVSAPFLFALLLCGAPLFLAGCAESADAKQLRVTYYYQPGCDVCEQAKAKVAALEKDFPEQVEVEAVDATAPDSARMVRMLGFGDHGLVVRGSNGAVLYKESNHDLKMDVVRQNLTELLAYRQASM